jgi:hypothetical protein
MVNLGPAQRECEKIPIAVKKEHITPGTLVRTHFYQLPTPFAHQFGLAPNYDVVHDSKWFGYFSTVGKTFLFPDVFIGKFKI